MPKNIKPRAILLIDCPDRQGLVAAITGFIYKHHGNIISLDQHVDRENGLVLYAGRVGPGIIWHCPRLHRSRI
jgi:formyltetrahydrofolate hydrolase